jgi:hypothetical protein
MSKLIPMHNLEHHFRMSLLWGVRYKCGAKFDEVTQSHPTGHYVDDAGYIQWLVLHGSYGELMLPADCLEQQAFIQQQGFAPREYSKALLNRSGSVYICFMRPRRFLTDHVWLLQTGQTMECARGLDITSRDGKSLARFGRAVLCHKLSE